MLGHEGVVLFDRGLEVRSCWIRCGLVGSMPLGLGFGFFFSERHPVSLSAYLLPVNLDVELSTTP